MWHINATCLSTEKRDRSKDIKMVKILKALQKINNYKGNTPPGDKSKVLDTSI